MTNGFIQFTDVAGRTVVTNGGLTFVKDGSRNLAFYGSRGRSELSDAEFVAVVQEVGFQAPVAPATAPTVASAIPDDLDAVDGDDDDAI